MKTLSVTSIQTYPTSYDNKGRQSGDKEFQVADDDGQIKQTLESMQKAHEAKAEHKQRNEQVSLPKALDPYPAMGMAQAKVLLKALTGEIKGASGFQLANTQMVSINSILPSSYV